MSYQELTTEESPTDKTSIPDIVIGRLPIYLRTLKLLHGQGQAVTSSQELGELLGISSAQIRKDLSHFGEFGKQGTGYDITYLCQQLEEILKVDCIWPVVLVGAGYLGHALASYNGFEDRGFRIVARARDRERQEDRRPLLRGRRTRTLSSGKSR